MAAAIIATAFGGAYLVWRGSRSIWKAFFAFFAIPVCAILLGAVLLGQASAYDNGPEKVFILGILVIAAWALFKAGD